MTTKYNYTDKNFGTKKTEHGITISMGNRKMGPVSSVSFDPDDTCNRNAPCYKEGKCYAKKMIRIFPSVGKSYRNNFAVLKQIGTEEFGNDIDKFIKKYGVERFRWQVSGDIPTKEYTKMMIDVADKNPDCEFFVFTKKYEMLEDIDEYPSNLGLILSVWDDYRPSEEMMSKYPLAYFQNKEGTYDIPDDSMLCSDDCAGCMVCFRMKKDQSVYFNEH